MQKIIKYLRAIASGKKPPTYLYAGICYNLSDTFNISSDKWHKYYKTWPQFSGDFKYPVPYKDTTPEYAYYTITLWEGEYGDARRSLCKHLADELEKELS